MVRVVEHLSVAELEARYEASEDVTSSRHFQTICLLAKGHSTRESGGDDLVRAALDRTTARTLQRVRAGLSGRSAARQRRVARVLKPELLQRLRVRLSEPPPDGGVWTSGKVARWMADELGLEKARSAARLGSAESGRLVDPEAAAAQPESRERRGTGSL